MTFVTVTYLRMETFMLESHEKDTTHLSREGPSTRINVVI